MRCTCGQENPMSSRRCSRCGRLLLAGMALGRLLLDLAAGAGLLIALVLVFLWHRGAANSAGPEPAHQPQVKEVVEEEDEDTVMSPLRLAVTPAKPEYDDMGKLLDSLGAGYRYSRIPMDDLLDPDKLSRFDVVFLTCAGVPDAWLDKFLRPGDRGGGVFTPKPEIVQRLRRSLRQYVGNGGTLYASDWQFRVLRIAFPELVDDTQLAMGDVQVVTAEVVDPGLKRRLGPAIKLRFDKSGWLPAAFDAAKVTTYLAGQFKTLRGETVTRPLLVQFAPEKEKGQVIFTSFHNEAQNSDTELELLRFLVFTTVTAQVDTRVKQTMLSGGFSPVERNLLSASSRDQSLTRTYECRGNRPLRFVLGFQARGAELRLSVVAPDGSRTEKTGTSTITIDIPDAAEGEWKYTITPLKIPYENFPFTLTVGEKK